MLAHPPRLIGRGTRTLRPWKARRARCRGLRIKHEPTPPCRRAADTRCSRTAHRPRGKGPGRLTGPRRARPAPGELRRRAPPLGSASGARPEGRRARAGRCRGRARPRGRSAWAARSSHCTAACGSLRSCQSKRPSAYAPSGSSVALRSVSSAASTSRRSQSSMPSRCAARTSPRSAAVRSQPSAAAESASRSRSQSVNAAAAVSGIGGRLERLVRVSPRVGAVCACRDVGG